MTRRPSIVVTAASLEALGACLEQVELFRATFGESVTVPRRASARRALASRVAEARLDCNWYAQRALSAPARRAYDEATAPAQRAHNEARATAQRAYQEATATALLDAIVADADRGTP